MAVSPTLVIKGGLIVKKHWKTILIIIMSLMLLTLMFFGSLFGVLDGKNEEEENERNNNTMGSINGTAQVPPHIERWRPLVEEYALIHGVEEYTEFFLAKMYQEIGSSSSLDIMQASESLGLPPNTIQDPVRSVDQGIKYFTEVLAQGNEAGVDFFTVVQSYNMGGGYIDYVVSNGGTHSQELAQGFSDMYKQRLGWDVYGDPNYVERVMSNLDGGYEDTQFAGNDAFQAIMNEVTKYDGDAYQWAGMHPSTGFDCSGLLHYAFEEAAGISLPRTAQQQYDASERINYDEVQPGDLVFFEGTYQAAHRITHVGIYVGDGVMFDANGSGVGYSELEGYWSQYLVGYGRVADFS